MSPILCDLDKVILWNVPDQHLFTFSRKFAYVYKASMSSSITIKNTFKRNRSVVPETSALVNPIVCYEKWWDKFWHQRQGQTYADLVLCNGKYLHAAQESKICSLFLCPSLPFSFFYFGLQIYSHNWWKKSHLLDNSNYNFHPTKIIKIIVCVFFRS